jgi:3-oxoacyl-[acyl-carrier protein] reductase
MDLGLAGTCAVVTGASRGIGAAITQDLAREGCNLAVCARDGEALSALAEGLRAEHGVRVNTYVTDVTDPGDVERLAASVVADFGEVNILVNNAGRSHGGRFEVLSDQNFIDDYTIKVLAHIRMIRAFLPALEKASNARVININSIHGHDPDPRFFTSSVNRAASIAFAKVAALEVVKRNVLINTVNVGYVVTPQWHNVHQRTNPDLSWEEFLEVFGAEVPLGRLGRPEEVAAAVTFFASSRASYLSGASLDVGGGIGVGHASA